MRKGKLVHWHIDQLTERGAVTGAWIVPKGRECDLVTMLARLPMPIPGFGSSDCRRCRSHLLYCP
jgi:Uri superfamily endonuclease